MLLLKNGSTVYGEKIDLLIDGHRIVDIAPAGTLTALQNTKNAFSADAHSGGVIDIGGKLIMPGIIDLHTHMREPGLTHKEDFYSGSRACAKGGITCFFDMPNTLPPTVTEKDLLDKIRSAQKNALVHFGFHFGASRDDNSAEIRRVTVNGSARSVKVFLNESTGCMLIEDKTLLERVFKAGALVFVHAENDKIDTAIQLNARFGSGLYICHISSEKEMRSVIAAKQNPALNNERTPIYAEVTPHHLFLHAAMKNEGTQNNMLLRMKPELKNQSDCDFLWQALTDGFVDTLATDHAPHTKAEKLEKPCFGIPGTEASLALMLTAAADKRIDLPLVQKLMCENPAAVMHLSGKGRLQPGFDADITVADTCGRYVLRADDIVSKCAWSPYEGFELRGKTCITIVNGEIVYRDGRFYPRRTEACTCSSSKGGMQKNGQTGAQFVFAGRTRGQDNGDEPASES